MIRALKIGGEGAALAGVLTLPHADRIRRRIALTCDNGFQFLLDLPDVTELRDGDLLALEDGRAVRVAAAVEPLMQAVARDPLHLAQAAWHVGNRHTPAEIRADRLILRRDHVLADMLRGLGCEVSDVLAPFNPLSGAYGRGRTQGHSHGHDHHHH